MKTRALKADGVSVVTVHDEHAAADAVIAAHQQRIISECHAGGTPIPEFEVSTFTDARENDTPATKAKKGAK